MPPYEGSYSGSDEEQILAWAAELTSQPSLGSATWPDTIRDGVALCELANALRAGVVPKVSRSAMPFPQRENIKAFIDAARSLGVHDRDNFDTSDLFEDKNLNQVRICLINLGRAAYEIEGYSGPCLGKPIAAGRGGGKHARVETTGLWGKAGGQFGTADRPTAGSSGAGPPLGDLRPHELKKMLKAAGLDDKGSKAELTARLQAFQDVGGRIFGHFSVTFRRRFGDVASFCRQCLD